MTIPRVLFVMALLAGARPADTSAQSLSVPSDARVVYVSSQRLSTESAVGKAGLARIQAIQTERSAQVRARQQALEATRKQLASATSTEERSRLGLQEEVQRADSERAAVQMQADLQTAQREVSAELRVKVLAVLNDLLKGTTVEMVMNLESAVVWASPALDITGAVIQKMNAPGPVTP